MAISVVGRNKANSEERKSWKVGEDLSEVVMNDCSIKIYSKNNQVKIATAISQNLNKEHFYADGE